MSADIDYYFKSDKSFEKLCEEMREYLDFIFGSSREGKNHVYFRFLGIGLDFYIHEHENDGELKFEEYKYFTGLTARTYSKEFRIPIIAFIANILYAQLDVSAGFLLYNQGRLLAKYREEINSEGFSDLYDEVSNKFVEFPHHLNDLYKLIR